MITTEPELDFPDLDKKWKYLRFLKDDGYDGWNLCYSDERFFTSDDTLLSSLEVNGRLKRDEIFLSVFNAVASDSQLIECSDGLYQAFRCSKKCNDFTWKIFPVYFNRLVWKQFSHYVRYRRKYKKRDQPTICVIDICWMNIPQLKVARRLLVENFSVDISDIDKLIAFQENV